jgi:putative methylase
LGRVMQKRIVRKLDLERFLSRIEPHEAPKPDLEQYTIPTDAAATMLYISAYKYGDITNKTVLDLGCGTGRLALGAAFLGAEQVVGVDIDREPVNAAFHYSKEMDLHACTQWVVADLEAIHGKFDTVLQNPPYGVQKLHADRRFLEKALEAGKVVYSLHKSVKDSTVLRRKLKANPEGILSVAPSAFIKGFVEKHGGKVRAVYAMLMTVPHMFSFHEKTRHEFVVDLYVLEGR